MTYQIWTLHPVKPRKGESKFKGCTVTYSKGTEGSEASDLRHVRKMVKMMAEGGALVLVGAVNGKPVHIDPTHGREYLPRCAFLA